MSKLKEKSEYLTMRVSGFLGWLHRLVMLITFPIRKFWLFVTVLLIILVILVAIPMFYGIRFHDVWDWYMVKMPAHEFIEAKDKTLFDAEKKIDKLKHTFNEIVPGAKNKSPHKEKEYKKSSKNELISWHVAEFKKAKYKPQKKITIIEKIKEIKDEVNGKSEVEEVSIEEAIPAKDEFIIDIPSDEKQYIRNYEKTAEVVSEDNDDVLLSVDVENMHNNTAYRSAYKGNIEDYYTKLRSADLHYLKTPEIYEGEVRVIGPNSFYINGNFVFLYGIYSHPRRHDISAATEYLRNITQGHTTYCEAVAYSRKTHSPTVLCFVDGVFINKSLTEHNLAKNIALK